MVNFALGLIETKGLVGAIEAADAMVKTASVRLIGKEQTTPALITIKIVGETAAVRSAVEAGAAAAQRVGQLISKHVIPRPAEGIEDLIFAKTSLSEKEIADLLGEEEPAQKTSFPETPEPEPDDTKEIFETPQFTAETKEGYIAQLDRMTVHELRRFARIAEGLSIHGREISRANKDELMKELIRAKFGD